MEESTIAFDSGLACSDDEGSGDVLMLSGVAADGAVEAAISSRSRRQVAWDQKLDSVDQKHAELMTIQWKFVRDQLGKLGKEGSVIQADISDLRIGSRRALTDIEKHLRETDLKILEERSQRVSMNESVEQLFSKTRADMDTEAKQRTAAHSEVLAKIEHVSVELAVKHSEQAALERHVNSFEDSLGAASQTVDTLRESVVREAGERKAAEASILEELRELRTALCHEIQERTTADEDICRSFVERADRDRDFLAESLATVRSSCKSLHVDLQQQREELPALHNRIDELAATLASHASDRTRYLERGSGETAAALHRLEKRIEETSAVVERTSLKQDAMVDEVEEMLTSFRTRMRGQLNEHAEASRVAREALQLYLDERFEKEVAERDAQHAAVISDIQIHKSSLWTRVETMQRSLQIVEQRRGDEAPTDESARVQELARQIKELRDTFFARLAEERSSREACDSAIEDHLDYLDRFLSNAREIFAQKCTRYRQPVRKPSAPSRIAPWNVNATPRSMTPVGIRSHVERTEIAWPAQ